MDSLGKMLMLFGAVLFVLGGLLLLGGRLPFLGRLPGDLVIRRESWSLYFPLTTSILVSVLLTLLLWLFGRR
jgi:membrane protein implicated in regulation of membrane protease activity